MHQLQDVAAIKAKQEFSFIPIDEDINEVWGDTSEVIEPFENLTANLQRILQNYSADCGVAYVETEYHGGTGAQAAISWINSSVDFPATLSTTKWNSLLRRHSVTNGSPINEALQRIGVERVDGLDEFDSIGLGEHRTFYKHDG